MQHAEILKQTACAAIDAAAARLVAFGEDIFRHPELGFRETRTGQKVVDALTNLGLHAMTRPARTGVKAWLSTGRPGPHLAILGELDAVISPLHPFADPVTGAAHACGHHAQLAALVGAAVGLRAVTPHLAGQVCFLATPAEEYIEIGYRSALRQEGTLAYLGGKQQLIDEGAFSDIDLAMMVHAETDVDGVHVVTQGPASGFIGKSMQFIGQEAHAGGAPWKGVNALNAAALAIQAIHAQRETFRDQDAVRVHPILTKGGDLVNTVPADVRMESYVRAANLAALQDANAKVNRAVRGAAYAVGAEVKIEELPGYLPLEQNDAFSAIFAQNAQYLLPQARMDQGLPFCGSTDMGDLSYLIPVIQPTISGFSGALHSKDFTVVDPALAYLVPAKLLAMTAIDLLSDNAAAARHICQTAPRRTEAEYRTLWAKLLREAGDTGGFPSYIQERRTSCTSPRPNSVS